MNKDKESINEWISRTENPGTFIRYKTLSREDLMNFINNGKIYSVFKDYKEKVKDQITYKDKNLYTYRKTNNSGKKYMNIYAHLLMVMLPERLPDIEHKKIIEIFLNHFDPRIKEKKLLWIFKLRNDGHSCYADVVVFTRPFLKHEEPFERYDSDYWWNPVSKIRGKSDESGCVLLHKKGEYRLDKDGNRIKRAVSSLSDMECQIFKYAGRTGFMKMILMVRKVLKNILQSLLKQMYKKRCCYFKKINSLKKHKQSTLYKIMLRNSLIESVNKEILFIFDSYRYGGLDEDDYLCEELKKLLQRLKMLLYKKKFSYKGWSLSLEYNIPWIAYKMNFEDLWSAVNDSIELFRKNIAHYTKKWWI